MTRLPPDDHVHTEWSWDASAGSMERTCARAVELGLPSVAFTEHVDQTEWVIPPGSGWPGEGARDRFRPPPFDPDGYLAELARCRNRFPEVRIVAGVEVGEPHRFAAETTALTAGGRFERVLGSVHTLDVGGEPWIVDELFGAHAPPGLDPLETVRAYLGEVLRMVESSDAFAVLAHIDYPIRRWPTAPAGPFDPRAVEDETRAVLHALAASGRALEVNTRVPLASEVVAWWHEAGGDAITFASDAHSPDALANRFAEAAAMVEANGFRPGRRPTDLWGRG